jgi:hypothetical protein
VWLWLWARSQCRHMSVLCSRRCRHFLCVCVWGGGGVCSKSKRRDLGWHLSGDMLAACMLVAQMCCQHLPARTDMGCMQTARAAAISSGLRARVHSDVCAKHANALITRCATHVGNHMILVLLCTPPRATCKKKGISMNLRMRPRHLCLGAMHV